MITKKDFEAVAKILNDARRQPIYTNGIITDWSCSHFEIVNKLSDYFEEQNERFDDNKFIKACLTT